MYTSLTRGLFGFVFLLFSVLSFISCGARYPEKIAITRVTLIDATGAPPQQDMTVLVADGRISAIGHSTQVAVPSKYRHVDGSGKFLIPGLADMHIHLTGAGEPSGSREFILPLLVANGITTVRDMGGKVEYLKELRAEISSGKRLGPQIFFTGPYLDGNPPSFQPSIVVQTPAEAAAAVDKLKAEGVDFIKVQSRLQPEPYYAIADEAKKDKIRFLGHVPDSITAAVASDSGQASIEHLTGVLLGCSTREAELREQQVAPAKAGESQEEKLARERAWTKDLLDSYSDEQAARLIHKFAANRTWQVPTFPTLVHLGFVTPETDLGNDPRMKYVPEKVRETWQEGRNTQLAGRDSTDFAQRAAIIRRSLEIVDKMNQAGVPIMAGTDAAAPNVFPGSSLHEDLAYLVQAGLTPLQALQAATARPAEFLERSAQQGTIQVGKRADLLLLDANPLDDIHNTTKIRAVILNGQLLERSDLDKLLAGVERFAAKP
ncbi:MAG TPA: amidohydrolase family protein [Candidatus Sulfotelmatobacter sp.]|nr:amidohydrolase family protein [Candidatus Sulfotelmatobacter sp.]